MGPGPAGAGDVAYMGVTNYTGGLPNSWVKELRRSNAASSRSVPTEDRFALPFGRPIGAQLLCGSGGLRCQRSASRVG